ncbi:MAG: type II toxin-antitoxin system HicB family antitoxin [Candidatus Sumerlaeota bacterium]|nr:type II toxin-antitoxin system HicB family antitoxin [Candidatus Sumerlaeota bacterium]
MLLNYVQAAMRDAQYEILPDDGMYYGEIPACNGVYAHAKTLEKCREELQEVLEEWILFRVSRNMKLPVISGQKLAIRKAA